MTLTPFEVTAETDTGYAATQTLAGTRIRTDLRDVGGAVSVVTREFLADIGATDNSTLLQYTTNTEVAGTRGTFAGLGNGPDLNEQGQLRAPGGAQRVRGLAAADNTRDFFVTDIPWDSFNVDRIDIQRGPNSILFGLGSPAGIINASTRNAEFRDRGSVEARVGSYGSWRGALDINQELVDNVLAIRIDGLWDEERFQQDHTFENDKRIYGAIRFDPQLFARRDFRTSIKAKFEDGQIDANRPRIVPPNNSISPWFRPLPTARDAQGRRIWTLDSGMGRTPVLNGYDAFRSDAANHTDGDGRGLQSNASPNYQPWLTTGPINQQQPWFVVDGSTGAVQRTVAGYINVGARNADGSIRGPAQGVNGRRYADQVFSVGSLAGSATNLRLPGAGFGQYRNETLQDDSIFDFYNTLIDGPNKSEFEKWNAYNIDVQQTGFDDRLGVQLIYDRQKYKRGGQALLAGTPTLTMDIGRNLQDYYLSGANGIDTTTNPNYGRPFIASAGGGNGSTYESDRQYYRGSLFGEVRARDIFQNDFLVKLFGRQRFNGVWSQEEYSTENRSWINYANDQAWAGYWNGNNGSGSDIADRGPVPLIYLGSSIAGMTSAAGANIPGIDARVTLPMSSSVYLFDSTWQNFGTAFDAPWVPTGPLVNIFPGDNLTQSQNPANYAGWNSERTLNLLAYDNGANLGLLRDASLSKRETESWAASWQGYFWNDAVIPTLGWRYDVVKSKAINAQKVGGNRSMLNLNPDVYRLPDGYGPPAGSIYKDHSTSGGAVVHLNRLLGDRDPLPINVTLSYNKSNNFAVTDARRDVYGNTISNPTGSTKDYGIVLSTKDDKYSFRAIKYETELQGGSSSLPDAGGIGRVVQQGLRFRNVFLYDLAVYDWNTREQPQGRNTWGGSTAQGDPFNGADQTLTLAEGRALEDQAIRTWNEIQAFLTQRGFFDAWGFQPQPLSVLTDRTTYEANPSAYTPPDTSRVFGYVATQPPNFTVTADTVSKGYEFELTANPLPNWRLAFNASQSEAVRNNVGGPVLEELIGYLDQQLTGTPAGNMPQFGNTGLSIFANVYGPWRANYVLMRLQEGSAAPEIREWRYNFVTNYTFREGRLKGLGLGGSYRWQDEVIIGYPVDASANTFDLSRPYYGPSEDAIDLWASYERKLTDKINWRIQLNIRNAFADEGLIPISIQPDGQTWAGVRVKPVQEWFVTNTFSF